MKIENIKVQISRFVLAYKSLKPKKILFVWTSLLLGILFLILGAKESGAKYLISIPTYGGSITEGIVGTPRFINSVLAYSAGDKDLSRLIYSGLLKKSNQGEISEDLAQSISVSEDGLHYTVILKDKLSFHDGTALTTDDVIYTINQIQNKNINSPLYIKFEGVTMQKISDKEIVFNLKRPFVYFKESLTLGILPKHIWQNLSKEEFSLSDLNINAIGSGPYLIKNIKKVSGIPTEIELHSFKEYALGRPYIDTVNIKFYSSESLATKAITNKDIDSLSNADLNNLKKNSSFKLDENKENISISSLPNLYSISINPNKNAILADKNLRQALAVAINKKDIQNVFGENVRLTKSLLPFLAETQSDDFSGNIPLAKSYLEKFNSKKIKPSTVITNTKVNSKSKSDNATSTTSTSTSSTSNALATSTPSTNTQESTKNNIDKITLNISTVDNEELKSVAESIKKDWEALGFRVNVKVYELSDFTQNIIKNRDFEILLFGSVIEKDIDLYAYWHSSQRAYPGLNITGYASKNLDKNLTDLRDTQDIYIKSKKLEDVKKELEDEMYQIPLYSKVFAYIRNKNFETPQHIQSSEDRYSEINNWYIYKENVLKNTFNKELIEKLQNLIH